MSSGRRTNRLGDAIREEVANILARGLKDPRIGFVTVTRVEIVSDLSVATVSVGVLGDEKQRAKTMAGLRQATGFIRRELGQRLQIRHTPELKFSYDNGLDATERVAKLLDETKAADIAAYAASTPPEETEPVDGDQDADDDDRDGKR